MILDHKSGTTMIRTCKTLSVPEAGRIYYNLGRNGSYAFAKERPDLLPTIQVRGRRRVSVARMDRIVDGTTKEENNDPAAA